MKTIHLILVLVFSIASTAQDESAYTTAPDMIIIKSKLASIVRVDVTRSDPPPDMKGPPHFESNPPMQEWQGRAELEVRNAGSKSIKSIDWEFFLTTEATSERITRSYRIHSKKAIRPGQTVKVTAWIKDAYLKELREHLKRGLLQGHAEIKRVKYAGGGIWLPLKVTPKRPQ
ncbi:MAG TPA: hypothetical protein VIC84_05450 [Blastocatellia bacterium]|jgi:hypothetical protein